ncbi:D-mannose binding lectin [Actinopolymorpha cephalotaxi]|uniref:D-mannose binding lectin n=1 Tax=Actinopolymorpha cephalotaxi TaxID=504797 RepID=A0A1I2SMG9_9ACTN|nr:thiol-activated cytolysin family protein [Actinopolymorpha cephalotaxi]NYH84030.1 hypothetical protein [Actinopolymorpha cephalotaxi]SFG53944.1 D-mannose binding lectin [Actinopolymorpha cephalotaxi]
MTDRLSTDKGLGWGEQLISPNGQFALQFQTDGNLVLYQDPVASTRRAYWSTNTWWLPADQKPTRAVIQTDGHFVCYDAGNRARWASGTWGPAFHSPYIVLGDDGNLVIYANGTEPVWASGGPGGVGSIPPRGYVTEPGGLNGAVDQCGRLPAVVAGSADLAPPSSTTVDVSGVAYTITEQRRRLTSELVEQAFLQDIAAMGVWPGQVIQGRSLLNGDVAPIGPLQRVAGTLDVVTDLITNTSHGQSAQVAAPSSATVNEARRKILVDLNPVDSPGLLKAGVDKASTLREVGVKLGVTVKGSAFGVDANASLNSTYRQSTAVAVIRQVFYSVTFTPGGAGANGFWPSSVSWDQVAPFAGPGNPPVYIDSVQYGRLICVTAQGSFSSTEMTAALRAHYNAGISGSGSLDVRTKEVLESSQVKVYTIGVPGRANFQTLADPINELQTVYRSGLVFNASNLGAPISFTCRHIADNTIARVALAAEYLQPLSAVGGDISNRQFPVFDGPGGGLVDTGITVNPKDVVTVRTTGLIWSGVIFSQPHGPEGWPGHKADPAAPAPRETAYMFIIRFGNGQWIPAGPFWEAEVPAAQRGRLQLNINDNNPYNGDRNKRWTSTVSVRRANAAAAGVFI